MSEPEVTQLSLIEAVAKKEKKKSIKKGDKIMSQETEQTLEPEVKIDFEASLLELENVVKQLDSEVKLDRALKLFESGIKLSVDCESFIKGARKKIEILKKRSDGGVELAPYQSQDNGDNQDQD
ncbi:MAG: exodeoxyribonuclease VII small subunit [Candidatus Obscuribacter sp.]|jgi:exodeoxyribonuclease VII small subunit|nr:exodeoxyribonuclease VII small subunit [Candidatus Obscuribacter sp.]MBK7841159.1 exodeoxyribonuclease VII small subunit [Candidatus Obscuribacter sp.]MBK9201335.1 exodeoxyribonuclease VII small subunit [Candidatus Obscuribacter sp.]MBK9622774.1 exodeoxyribonuclease VII small subunit [Candidatus Obscuribacter sp.]MBK9774047.1 exodeoxyribonuclease VII small subunit [Candidatus Obscuribacter sp.]